MDDRQRLWLAGLLGTSAALVTLALGIFAAQPWGDNAAYTAPGDYALLGGFLVWSALPACFVAWSGRFQPGRPRLGLARMAVISVVCIGGPVAIVNAIFIEVDAQGGLVFLAVPVYQWLLLAGAEIVLRTAARN